jgi:hypothetical protein
MRLFRMARAAHGVEHDDHGALLTRRRGALQADGTAPQAGSSIVNATFSATWKCWTLPLAIWPLVCATSNQRKLRIVELARSIATERCRMGKIAHVL